MYFLKNFFNDENTCIGLCDLRKKTSTQKVFTISFASQRPMGELVNSYQQIFEVSSKKNTFLL